MNAVNAIMAIGSMIGALMFCGLICHLMDHEKFYSQHTQVMLARSIVIIGALTMVAWGYTAITEAAQLPDYEQFIPNVICASLATLLLGGLGWLMLVLEPSILRLARQ